MPAASYNFEIEQGSYFEINFQYNDSNGNPIDLSGSCVLLRWQQDDDIQKHFKSDGTASLDNESGYSLSGNNLGQIAFKIASKKTKDYSFGTAVYDLDIITNTGTESVNTRILTGTVGLVTRNFTVETNCAAISDNPEVSQTPTATATDSPTVTATPTVTSTAEFEDFCLPADCANVDVFSTVYSGDSLVIQDNAANSGTIVISNTGLIENFELAVNGLRHNSPQDLLMVLTPPSGSGILLSAHSKIPSYVSGESVSFMFSNRANAGAYLHNISNGQLCNIYDKTDMIRYNNNSLLYSFDHLLNSSASGTWTLNIDDTDVGISGSIDSWKIIVTYPSSEETEE